MTFNFFLIQPDRSSRTPNKPRPDEPQMQKILDFEIPSRSRSTNIRDKKVKRSLAQPWKKRRPNLFWFIRKNIFTRCSYCLCWLFPGMFKLFTFAQIPICSALKNCLIGRNFIYRRNGITKILQHCQANTWMLGNVAQEFGYTTDAKSTDFGESFLQLRLHEKNLKVTTYWSKIT